MAVPRLELDRPFTYLVPDGLDAPLGSLVSVPFHGRTVRGYVLGGTEDVPRRVLPIRRVLSREPLFDRRGLRLYRWLSERYVAPLSTAIGRAIPPRVASEEGHGARPGEAPRAGSPRMVLASYRGGAELLAACAGGSGAFVLRPLPADEAAACVEAVTACLHGGRDALVLVPEADPLPSTARAVAEAVGPAALLFVGGDRRARYRAWLETLHGRYRAVVGTRPGVFAPLPRLGLVWVAREAHGAYREERSPHHHAREVALARGALEGAVVVLAGLSPSGESVAEVEAGRASTVRPPRAAERRAAPIVETVRPGDEDRSPRVASLLGQASGAFLLVSRRGYGVARVCRSCSEPAACPECRGPIAVREGRPACTVCGAAGRCARCGGTSFGLDRGGTERVAEWAAHVTRLPVHRADGALAPEPGAVVVGTAASVRDVGPRSLGLVAILDPDRARRRPGLSAAEQVLATWMEASAWAGGRDAGGRVVVQTAAPGDPAIQALVRWDPWHFHGLESRRRAEAGFPPGAPVFRVVGTPGLREAMEELRPIHLLSTSAAEGEVSLVTLSPEAVPGFRAAIVGLVGRGVVARVDAEPHL